MGSSEICGILNRVRQPFNVNLPALAAAEAALDDKEFLNKSKKINAEGIAQVSQGLKAMGFKYIDGKANFLAAQIPNAEEVFIKLQKLGIIVRPLKGYGMTGWLRLTIGTQAQNNRLLDELKKI
jgi:histidinol-phosphate aminotransferase